MAAQREDASIPVQGAPHYGATPVTGSASLASLRAISDIEDPDHHEYEQVEETAYTGAMAVIIKDVQRLYRREGTKHSAERMSRILFALGIMTGLVLIQCYLLVTIKTFVASPAVRSIRQVYGAYEETMYHGHVQDSGFGFPLGIGGPKGPYFDPAQFSKISNDDKGSICLIPFSQPAYLSIILFIWSLSIIGELRACATLCYWLKSIETHEDMEEAMQDGHDEYHEEYHDGLHVVVGLPMSLKCGLFFVVILPRLLTSLLIFWLGCRWLAATLDFTEVLINAVALEFVINLNSVLYTQFVTDRSKRELSKLRFSTKEDSGKPIDVLAVVGGLSWGIGAAVWIYLYICHLQLVLPGYQWDVRGPCAPWVAERFNFWRI